MPTVGDGVIEITINIGDAFRVFYVAKFKDAIHVLHAFQKKTRKTAKGDIDLGKQRYRALMEERQQLRKRQSKAKVTRR